VHGRAQDAGVVDAAVLVEAVVLDGQHGLLHDVGDVLDAHQVAALFAELADQHVIGGEDPQRHLGTVVGQRVEFGQVGVGHRQAEHHQQHACQAQAGNGQAGRASRKRDAGLRGLPALSAAARVEVPNWKRPCSAIFRLNVRAIISAPRAVPYDSNISA
jgi:hypothetical protein